VEVGEFQNERVVNIREFVSDPVQRTLKPTKTGIILSEKEWSVLVAESTEISELILEMDVHAQEEVGGGPDFFYNGENGEEDEFY
jgi:hypothetical protein